MTLPLLICLMGPTASGKTDLAIELAQAEGCELISVDSALVYRGLDIGSAKPDYPHHLMDVREPHEVYCVADFVADAHRLAGEITARGKVPLFVGGTMMYFKAFLEGLAEMPVADPGQRQKIEAEAAQLGWPHLHGELAKVDPQSAARIHPNHSQRLCRALEVYRSSGITMTTWQARQAENGGAELPEQHYRIVQMAICPEDRAVLHQRIALRFELMMQAGMLQEVTQLHARSDLHADLPAIRAVGYRQLWGHLNGDYPLPEAVDKAVAATRQLAKRQLTWLRKWPRLNWIYTDEAGNVVSASGSDKAKGVQKPLDDALNYLHSDPI
ncbi:MAG: tRNA dimethylallyltransferase [Halioglobus sp.]